MTASNPDPKYQPDEPPRPHDLDADVVVSPDTHRENRIPPGQTRTRKWPVLHASDVPSVATESWTLEIKGHVETPTTLDWNSFRELPRTKVFSDFHCVTTWSRLGNLWEGVSAKALMNRVGIRTEAKFVIITGYDWGWTTNLSLEEFLADDVLFVDTHDGELIDANHGGPVRLVVPRLYAWKSAKWVRRIELTDQDQPGYWEQRGYHNTGDPWKEQRFG